MVADSTQVRNTIGLKQGTSLSRAIIAVDFGPVGMGRRLEDLLSEVPNWMSRVRIVDPLAKQWSTESDTLDERVRHAITQLTNIGLQPGPIVIGQCTSTIFTLRLADQLDGLGLAPAMVALIDPVPVTLGFLNDHVRTLVVRLRGTGGAAEYSAPWFEHGCGPRDNPLVASELRSAAEQRLAGLQVEPADKEMIVGEIVDRYIEWIGFLCAQLGTRHTELAIPMYVFGAVTEGVTNPLQPLATYTHVAARPATNKCSKHAVAEQLAALIASVSV